ncbi:MAG TPA: helix-turn-helix transcriptional regulator [Solirubrobacteraceae bacterium]|nr:helix-turn-helix transcriptional regulator [Solirubrobacteraceae bacterium]
MATVTTAQILQTLAAAGVPQGELAARAGIARETISRWTTGAQRPSLEALTELVRIAGFELEVRLVPAEPKLVELVRERSVLGPTELVSSLVPDWPACRRALRIAAAVADLAVVVGPVAAALRGAPQRLASGRVDLVAAPEHGEALFDRLLAEDAQLDRVEVAPNGERREVWDAGAARLTVRRALTGVHDLPELLARAHPVGMARDDVGVVRVALAEDLLEVSLASPWAEDAVYRAGLRAVLASGLYHRRELDRDRSAAT